MLCFVRSDSDILEASWLNRAAASLATTDDGSAPFIHAELLFCPPTVQHLKTPCLVWRVQLFILVQFILRKRDSVERSGFSDLWNVPKDSTIR